MRIHQNMNPNDGIIEGFILRKLENNELVFYIFVDEDWKTSLNYTNILWTNDFSQDVNVRKMDFSNSEKGIYIDKVEGNFEWFKQNTNVGIYVGEINKDIIKNIKHCNN